MQRSVSCFCYYWTCHWAQEMPLSFSFLLSGRYTSFWYACKTHGETRRVSALLHPSVVALMWVIFLCSATNFHNTWKTSLRLPYLWETFSKLISEFTCYLEEYMKRYLQTKNTLFPVPQTEYRQTVFSIKQTLLIQKS